MAPGQKPEDVVVKHWGSGCVDAGRIGDDPVAYIATLDPFHGTTCCVYTKVDQSRKGMNAGESGWKRHVLDIYGTDLQRRKEGNGPGHFLVCADFDGMYWHLPSFSSNNNRCTY